MLYTQERQANTREACAGKEQENISTDQEDKQRPLCTHPQPVFPGAVNELEERTAAAP